MGIYGIDGVGITSAYSVNGELLEKAYAVNGDVAFDDKNIKVCTYNVGGWYIGSGSNVPADKDATYYALQNGMIDDMDADILCIEEYWDVFSKTGRTAASLLSQYYPYIETAGGNTTYMGRAICSKHPIINYTQHTFTGESRYYDCAEISVNGVTIMVFVTHLHPSDQQVKIAEATELFNFIKTQGYENYIVCGDFNSTLYDPFSETNAAIYNQFLAEGCTLANDGTFGIINTACNSADWTNDAFAIDNIICSAEFEIDSVGTDRTKISNAQVLSDNKIDHIPLYATISLAEGG